MSQRIAVLRGGKLVAVLPAAGADKALLAETMVGRRVDMPQRRPRPPGATVCSLQDATVLAADGRRVLDGVNLELRAGEIVAIAGVSGNGQQALAEALFGLHALSSGSLLLQGRAMAGARPRLGACRRRPHPRGPPCRGHGRRPAGVGERDARALREPAFSRAGIVKRAAAQAHARTLLERFDVRGTDAMGLDTPTRALSGGNMQKLILGRALVGDPDSDKPPTLIVADQPTWGLDVGAVAYVHQQLLDACMRGAAMLLITEDLDEIFALADRVAVLHHGRLSMARPAADWTLADIGLAMAGSDAGSEAEHAH